MLSRMKRALLVALVALAAAAPSPADAATRGLQLDRGIVQSVSAGQIVLRGLDGSTIALAVGARTRFFLNGQPVGPGDIQPGFSAMVLHDGARPAPAVRAFGVKRAVRQIDKGIVVSVSPTLIVLRQLDGTLVSVTLDGQTQVILNDAPASIADLRPGYLAAALHYGSEPARAVTARRRGP